MLNRIIQTHAPSATLLLRVVVGVLFISEGLQKFLHPETLGTGRFARIGLPSPDILAPFVGGTELVCGALVLLGLLTRLAALPLIVTMLVALVTTKIPILLGEGFWGLTLRQVPHTGILGMLHEARTDLLMLAATLFLACVGAGPRSLDAALVRRRSPDRAEIP